MLCPVCGKDVESDATTKEFCALCGMNITKENIVVWKSGPKTKYFCCGSCYKKYMKFHTKNLG
ncbi:hypothetical protein D6745_04695 [Candidatus Woesearchaeota archaeon]|nr:MAG: hypothetical protein D6745_04695 [Candidatus Woesearchaeota archaeon]